MSLETAYFVGVCSHCEGYELGNVHMHHVVLYPELFFNNGLVAVVLDLTVRAHVKHQLHPDSLKAVQFGFCYLEGGVFIKVELGKTHSASKGAGGILSELV